MAISIYIMYTIYIKAFCVFSELLQAVHKEGSKPGSMFAPISRLSEQGSVPTGNHPAHGFKRDLIRLIANMTYQNQTNQDLVCTNTK